jgi:hypothetical protein
MRETHYAREAQRDIDRENAVLADQRARSETRLAAAFAVARPHQSQPHQSQPGDPPCPDIGQRLARFLVLRAIGRTYADLGRAFNLSYEQVRLLLARHGEPPCLAGAAAAAMGRVLAASATDVKPGTRTHADHTHEALDHRTESA